MKINTILIVASLSLLASCGSGNEATDSTAGSGTVTASGKTLFNSNCIQCHSITQDKNGPKLVGSLERWGNDTVRLTAYIRNSQEVIKTDPYAAKLYKDWGNMLMPSFANLSDAEIREIIAYIAEGKDYL